MPSNASMYNMSHNRNILSNHLSNLDYSRRSTGKIEISPIRERINIFGGFKPLKMSKMKDAFSSFAKETLQG